MLNRPQQIAKQKGYLLISAAVLIIAFGFLAATVAKIVISDTTPAIHQIESTRAFYLAESKMEDAKYDLAHNDLTCEAPGVATWSTSEAFEDGHFKFKCTNYQTTLENPPTKTLSVSYQMGDTALSINDSTDLAPIGQVILEESESNVEIISYKSISTDNTICQAHTCNGGSTNCQQPCLLALKPGSYGTKKNNHPLNSNVTQGQYVIESQGAIPNFANPRGKRKILAAVNLVSSGGVGVGWAVGNQAEITRKINDRWLPIDSSGLSTNKSLYGISMVGNIGWVVGAKSGGHGFIGKWTGSEWTVDPGIFTNNSPNQTLRDIDCVNENDCWAVGNNGTIIRYQNNTWSNVSSPTNKTLHSISCVDANNCWAIGNKQGNSPIIVYWNGNSWTKQQVSTKLKKNFKGISCVNANNCWAVGNGGSIIRYQNGTWINWSNYSPTSKNLNGVSCSDATHCRAVGKSKTFISWSGGVSWVTDSVDIAGADAIPNKEFYDVACTIHNDCYAVGDNNAGYFNLAYWHSDDNKWKIYLPKSVSNVSYNALNSPTESGEGVVGSIDEIGWKEVFETPQP
jgi:photosystem II stability/assembly factor-like uncharacterized protein/Tfp pilus assembly protein PilX